MAISLFPACDRPDLIKAAEAMVGALWPKWLSTVAQRTYWSSLYSSELSAYQTIAIDDETGAVVGLANSVPLLRPASLPDTGWDWVLEHGAVAAKNGTQVDALSALAIALLPDQRGTGLAARLLEAMKTPARKAGLTSMVAPVRPTLKSLYPLQDFGTYCAWRRDDGTLFDPWLRTHEALGATVIGPAMASMTVTAMVAQWQEWTGLRLPASGRYAIPGALAPLEVDRASDLGIYREPNLWMQHPL